MMEQNLDPLFVQVICEWADLALRKVEEGSIVFLFGSYENEKIDEAKEWVKDTDTFIDESMPELFDKSKRMSSVWCKNMLLRIRKIRARRGPNFFFRSQDHVGTRTSSSTNMAPSEEFYYEIVSLNNIHSAYNTIELYASELQHEHFNEGGRFLSEIKQQLEGKFHETNSDNWYRGKTAEARVIMAKFEPAFSLQSQDLGILALQEKLRCEMRSLLAVKCGVSRATYVVSRHIRVDEIEKQLQERANEVNQFLTEFNLQLQQDNNSDWYRNKIAETKILIAKTYPPQHQIFLSFRGEDTRYGFTRNLYDALHQEGFNIFMDDEGLQRGDSISQVLMGTIENSKLSIIVFSKKFAESSWCLDEVAKILECKKKNNQLVWPIFYKVEPTDVRHQTKSYAVSMSQQEEKFGKDSEKVKKWRSSLSQVCAFKAFTYKKNSGYEGDFIQDIVKDVKNIRDQL